MRDDRYCFKSADGEGNRESARDTLAPDVTDNGKCGVCAGNGYGQSFSRAEAGMDVVGFCSACGGTGRLRGSKK